MRPRAGVPAGNVPHAHGSVPAGDAAPRIPIARSARGGDALNIAAQRHEIFGPVGALKGQLPLGCASLQ